MAETWLTRRMQAMSGATAWLSALGLWVALCVLLPVAAIVLSLWWGPVVPSAVVTATVPNPAGSMVAVAETVDNGMGFGQGRLYDEVHVLRRGESVTGHGTDSATVVYYIENDSSHMPPALSWTDDRHLTIAWQGDARPVLWPGAHAVVVRLEKQARAH